jgi:hypothetical protein
MERNRADYEALFAEIVNKMDERPRASSAAKQKALKVKKTSSIPRIAVVVGAILVTVALIFRQPQAAKRAVPAVTVSPEGVAPDDAKIIGNIKNWKLAKVSDFNLNFTNWLRGYGVSPASKIELDTKGTGASSGAAYLLVTEKTPGIKRVIWVVDHRAVYDTVGKIQGIAKIPREGMARITWDENGVPVETADGDGLLLIRDYTNANGATVFFVKNGKLCSGVPANIMNLEIR